MQRLHHNERQFWFIINFLNINSKCPDCKPSVCVRVYVCVCILCLCLAQCLTYNAHIIQLSLASPCPDPLSQPAIACSNSRDGTSASRVRHVLAHSPSPSCSLSSYLALSVFIQYMSLRRFV